ncbi:MAG: hypothetical protein KF900_09285 [Bacteroidetes bacterium]|nr:hypothetical protein [Bacteroidota bacterium]
MKKVKIAALALCLTMGSTVFNSCGNDADKDKNPLADSLKNINNNLQGQLSEKEEAIQEFIASFNEIQENLNAIKEKEKIVISAAAAKGDVRNRQSQIKDDIQSIYDLMTQNKNRINSLSHKLKESNLKMAGLEQMIENLQISLAQKDTEIVVLKNRIEGLNLELGSMTANYEKASAESAAKTDEMNTAYYAIGTSKELIEKKIISKEGGFIGLGKTSTMSADFNKTYFSKINITQTSSINIGAKKAKVVSNHPKSSYKLVGEKPVQKIEITNVTEFWSNSKYLVIIIEQ